MRDGFPLVELHRHLDGNVRLGTVLDLARRHAVDLPADSPEALRPHVQVTRPEPDLVAFLAKFEVLRRVLVDYEAVRRIARENVEDAAAEGIDYLELRFSPAFMAEPYRLEPAAVVEAVCDGVEEALAAEPAPPHPAAGAGAPPRVRLIGIISRNYGPETGWIELEAALEVCPTSNLQTSTVGSWDEHPLPLFLERGLLATLNTDDPSISGIDLAHEYRVAAERLGLGDPALRTLQENALEAAFLSSREREALRAAAAE